MPRERTSKSLPGHVSGVEFCRILGIHPNTLKYWQQKRRVNGFRRGRCWQIPLAEVRRIAAERSERRELAQRERNEIFERRTALLQRRIDKLRVELQRAEWAMKALRADVAHEESAFTTADSALN